MALAAPRICCLDLDTFFVCLSNLRAYDEQLCLFDATEPLHRAVDGIRKRFGYDALRIAHASPHRDR